MDEMLKKQDVLDAIYAAMEKTDKPDVVLGLAAAMSTVKQMQAAPVNPAEKVGRWEWVQYDANPEIGNFHCSECRYIPAAFNLSARRMHYCPNCGAKMGGEQNE